MKLSWKLREKVCTYITFVVDLFIFCSFSLYSKFWLLSRYKFDDERVTKEDIKRALEEQYGGEEEVISWLYLVAAFWFLFVSWIYSYFLTFSYLLSLWQLPQTNPGFNNTPFKFTKYSNAYMLVYIRESDKDKIVCNVDEKDIAEHLRVRCWYYVYSILFYITCVGHI